MLKKIQNSISDMTNSVMSGFDNNPMKKLVDIALKDGTLSDEEQEDLYDQVRRLDLDVNEFKFYLSGRLEEKKKENWKLMEALVEKAIKDDLLSEEERELLFKKAETLHLNMDDFKLYFSSKVKELERRVTEINSGEGISSLVSAANRKNLEVENERKKREQVWENRLLEIKEKLREFSVNEKSIFTIKNWWDTLTKQEKVVIRESAKVAPRFLGGYKEHELRQMYYKVVLEEKHADIKKQISTEIKERIENEYELVKKEKIQLSESLVKLQSIPKVHYKKYKIKETVKRIEANLKVDISLNLNVNLDIKVDDKFIEKLFDGADKLLNNAVVKMLIGRALKVKL